MEEEGRSWVRKAGGRMVGKATGRETRVWLRTLAALFLLPLFLFATADPLVAQPQTAEENGGYPVDVPTNRCSKCGTRYPTRQADADLYGTVTSAEHAKTCGEEPVPDPDPDPLPPAEGEDPPVVCGGVSAATGALGPPPSSASLSAPPQGPVKAADSLLAPILRRRILELRAKRAGKLLPFAGWSPFAGNLDVSYGGGGDFWKKAAE